MEAQTKSEAETEEVAKKLSGTLKAGDIVCLYGELGAGKTVFVKGIARGLGIKKRILSPTFVLMRMYPFSKEGKKTILYHLDLYRTNDFRALGFDEIFANDGITIIEWAEKIKELLPKKRWDVSIGKIDEEKRKIKITPPSLSFPRKRESSSGFSIESRMTSGKFSTSLPREQSRGSNINEAAKVLKSGGVVIFPTDTVYGIGCVFDNPKAVDRIYKIKGTPKNQLFPVLVSSVNQVKELANVDKTAKNLIKKHWPGGLTIVLYSKPGLEQLREPGLESKKIGFRMPNSKLLQRIINEVGPIIGTSANFHSDPTPKKYEDLDPNFKKLADLVLKGKCKNQVESTIIDTTVTPPKILRQGAISL